MSDLKGERCVLCLDEKRSPVHIQCGHSFCHECLDVYKSYWKYTWANKCPICRSALREKKRSVKGKLSISNDAVVVQNPSEISNMQSSSSGASNPSEQNHILEQFIAIATGDCDTPTADSLDSSQLNYSTPSALSEVTPMYFSDDSEDDMYANDDDDGDDDDDDVVDNRFSDSDEDSYFYYETDVSWDPQNLSVNAEGYEHDVIMDPEDSILVEDGSWLSTGSGHEPDHDQSTDSDVVILDDVIIVD